MLLRLLCRGGPQFHLHCRICPGSCSAGYTLALGSLASYFASVTCLSTYTWTWPSIPPPVPPLLHHPPVLYYLGSVLEPLLGGASVTNLVHGLPSDCHNRSPFHHIDSHTTHHTGLYFPSSIALMTHTHS